MFLIKTTRLALFFTLFSLIFAVTEAKADLIIRATVFGSDNSILDQEMNTVLRDDPPLGGSFIMFDSNTLTNFSRVYGDNLATTGNGSTNHSIAINITYTGPTGANSNKVVIEFLGTDYVSPSSVGAFISSNGSPSTGGLMATVVKMESGVSNSNAGLPGVVGDLTGFLGTTTGTGTMGMGNASSVLNPNPVNGNSFNISSKFSFYQVFTFNNFQNSGMGSLSAGSTVAPVPVPPTLALVFAASPVFAASLWRNRRKGR